MVQTNSPTYPKWSNLSRHDHRSIAYKSGNTFQRSYCHQCVWCVCVNVCAPALRSIECIYAVVWCKHVFVLPFNFMWVKHHMPVLAHFVRNFSFFFSFFFVFSFFRFFVLLLSIYRIVRMPDRGMNVLDFFMNASSHSQCLQCNLIAWCSVVHLRRY